MPSYTYLTPLTAVLEIINQFGHFSGVRINWSKPLFSLSVASLRGGSDPNIFPIIWVSKFCYLGIEIQKDPSL